MKPVIPIAVGLLLVIRRFLLHVLPKGFHRIRHYGLLAGATRKAAIARARALLAAPNRSPQPTPVPAPSHTIGLPVLAAAAR